MEIFDMNCKTVMIFFCCVGIAVGIFAGDILLPPVAKWEPSGKAVVKTAKDGERNFVKAVSSVGESGIRKRELKLQNAAYRLSFFYRTVKGQGRVIVKHGNNTYGLVNTALPASKEWKKYETVFTETLPGNHASVWLLTSGECDFADVKLEMVNTKLSAEKTDDPGLLPALNSADKWKKFGNAVVAFETEENIPVIKISASGGDGGVRYMGLALQKSAYCLKFSYRLKKGSALVVVKHGNNSYGLVNRKLTASSQWRQMEIDFTENIPGPHASVWFMTRGELEISQVSLHRKPSKRDLGLRILEPSAVSSRKASPPLPDLSGKIVLMQEYHLWFSSPFAEKGNSPGISVWGDISGRSRYFDPCGPLWRRGDFSLTYPYLGHYDSRNMEIVRWSLRVMKRAGLSGTFCQMYPDCAKNGETFTNLDLFEKYLKIAREEGYQLGIQDEIQFMPQAAQSVDAFIKRASEALLRAKKYPGAYVRIDNLMVYQFEAWGLRNWSTADFDRMTGQVERNVGEKIHWMVCGPPSTLYPSKDIKMLKAVSDVMVLARSEKNKINYGTGGSQKWKSDKILSFDDQRLYQHWADELKRTSGDIKNNAPGKEFTVWIYPGFNNAACVSADTRAVPDSSFDRGEYLVRNIRTVLETADPRIIVLSSWNERREKSNFEPSVGGENEDPFYLIKLLAKMKKADFSEPPLPPKEYVDPWRWSELYGIDRTPPAITGVRAVPVEARIEVDAVDDLSGIRQIRFSAAPWCFFQMTDEPASFGGVCSGNGSIIKNNSSVQLRIMLQKMLKGNAVLAIKSRIPEGYELVCTMNYPRSKSSYQFMLNLRQVTTVPPGPVFFGDGQMRYRMIPLIGMDDRIQGVITLNMKLRPIRTNLTPDEKASAEVSALVIYPEEIKNESARGFFILSKNKILRNAVLEIPEKLLPRRFFDLPLALQVVDNSGNYSLPLIFDIESGEECSRRSIIHKKVDLW